MNDQIQNSDKNSQNCNEKNFKQENFKNDKISFEEPDSLVSYNQENDLESRETCLFIADPSPEKFQGEEINSSKEISKRISKNSYTEGSVVSFKGGECFEKNSENCAENIFYKPNQKSVITNLKFACNTTITDTDIKPLLLMQPKLNLIKQKKSLVKNQNNNTETFNFINLKNNEKNVVEDKNSSSLNATQTFHKTSNSNKNNKEPQNQNFQSTHLQNTPTENTPKNPKHTNQTPNSNKNLFHKKSDTDFFLNINYQNTMKRFNTETFSNERSSMTTLNLNKNDSICSPKNNGEFLKNKTHKENYDLLAEKIFEKNFANRNLSENKRIFGDQSLEQKKKELFSDEVLSTFSITSYDGNEHKKKINRQSALADNRNPPRIYFNEIENEINLKKSSRMCSPIDNCTIF